MMKHNRIMIIVTFFITILISGCAPSGSQDVIIGEESSQKQEDQDQENEKSSEDQMEEFHALVSENATLKEIIEYIDQNMETVSKENASLMVNILEEEQKDYLPKLEEKFYVNSTIQQKINEEYEAVFGEDPTNDVKDEKVKTLLVETIASGYKMETAEGTFFPIIDYAFYTKYSSYVTSDVKDYIELMAVESNDVPAKDAALVISWDEVLQRAINQEKFIDQHASSAKIDDIKQLYSRYLVYAFYGVNNTPLFDYDTERLNTEVKESYVHAITSNRNDDNSTLLSSISDFLDILEKSDYKLTKEAETFREKHAMDEFQKHLSQN